MISARAEIITRRTYAREKEDGAFETWQDIIDRVINHQKWLWQRARRRSLTISQEKELEELRLLMLQRKVLVAGRTLWLGGTEVARKREASQFNCSFLKVETVHDIVDVLWLLMQGCGVGVLPISGTLNGFARPISEITSVRSRRTDRGVETNHETFDADTGTWTIKIGDSAEAWAKAAGKLIAGKFPAQCLVLDFSEVRPSGTRLNKYGWISAGDAAINVAFHAIAGILNRRAGQLLTRHDIHDIVNWMGTILSSRRSSEIVLYDYGSQGWQDFAKFKKDFWVHGNEHRQQSNNSLLFWSKPTKAELREIFEIIVDAGGSEPGFINASAALKRAPWFVGVNPCAEILLGNKSFCNLVEVNIAAFGNDAFGLSRAIQIVARANYRQTCVDLRDGVLQSAWHENNEFLRLCGVGLTGIAARPNLSAYDLRTMRNSAVIGAYGMAEELGLPRPKNVTTIKPSGTLSKIMDATEGAHKPLGKYIFNNVKMSSHDPLVPILISAGYSVVNSPNRTDIDTVLAKLPVKFENVQFDIVNGVEVNIETAIEQLERYRLLMDNYVDHNCSITVSYGKEEIDEIIDWVYDNWDSYVGVSWLFRADPTKSAKDLGYDYLPQEVVTREKYEEYISKLEPISLERDSGTETFEEECSTGACPVR